MSTWKNLKKYSDFTLQWNWFFHWKGLISTVKHTWIHQNLWKWCLRITFSSSLNPIICSLTTINGIYIASFGQLLELSPLPSLRRHNREWRHIMLCWQNEWQLVTGKRITVYGRFKQCSCGVISSYRMLFFESELRNTPSTNLTQSLARLENPERGKSPARQHASTFLFQMLNDEFFC